MISTKIEITIPVEQLVNWLIDLCDLPESFSTQTTERKITIKTDAESKKYRQYLKAKTQEMLRKRFSVPERMESNKIIIDNY